MFEVVGLGAVAAMVYPALLSNIRGLLKGIGLSAVPAGAILTAFTILQNLWIALTMLFLSGFGMMFTAAGNNTLLQSVATDELRGACRRPLRVHVFRHSFLGLAGQRRAGSALGRRGDHGPVWRGRCRGRPVLLPRPAQDFARHRTGPRPARALTFSRGWVCPFRGGAAPRCRFSWLRGSTARRCSRAAAGSPR